MSIKDDSELQTTSPKIDFSSPREIERWRKKLATLICVEPAKVCDWMIDDFNCNLIAWRTMATGKPR